jgi:hypothetical protein
MISRSISCAVPSYRTYVGELKCDPVISYGIDTIFLHKFSNGRLPLQYRMYDNNVNRIVTLLEFNE